MNAGQSTAIEQGLRVGVRGPRTLAGLMSMYERNWKHFGELAPELQRIEGTTVSRVAGALDLYLTVLERAPYTTTLLLTYHFDRAQDQAAEPNACLRVYHDARMVELTEQLGESTLEQIDAAMLITNDLVELVVGLAAEGGFDLQLGDASFLPLELVPEFGLAHAGSVRAGVLAGQFARSRNIQIAFTQGLERPHGRVCEPTAGLVRRPAHAQA